MFSNDESILEISLKYLNTDSKPPQNYIFLGLQRIDAIPSGK